MIDQLHTETIDLLKQLIAAPSISKSEDKTADLLQNFFSSKGIEVQRIKNNVWARNKHFKPELPTILLNSHHDTVPPAKTYTNDPYEAIEQDDKLYGLGSNDAGGALVSLIASFLNFYERDDLNHNLIIACTAEEEISGRDGVALFLNEIEQPAFGIVGEPTLLDMAIAEKGLMVLDCVSHGISGHAARDEGENAILTAIEDIAWLESFQFEKTSALFGEIKLSTTMIKAGSAHNVVPDSCAFVVDVRTTDAYTNEEVVQIISEGLQSEVNPRSTRLQPSSIGKDHVLVKAADELGISTYGSPTLSDQALMPFPTVKIGPGDSERSHTADEFIYKQQIRDGIETYISMLNYVFHLQPKT